MELARLCRGFQSRNSIDNFLQYQRYNSVIFLRWAIGKQSGRCFRLRCCAPGGEDRPVVNRFVESCCQENWNALQRMRKQPATIGAQRLSATEGLPVLRLLSVGMSDLPEDDHGEKAVPAQEAQRSGKQRRLAAPHAARVGPAFRNAQHNPVCPEPILRMSDSRH